MVKFLQPPCDRGIALLVHRFGNQLTSTYPLQEGAPRGFACAQPDLHGTDFSQEDMAVTRYADDFTRPARRPGRHCSTCSS
jgi:hypothetical protein